jgi:iron complex outermembrane receptor protein
MKYNIITIVYWAVWLSVAFWPMRLTSQTCDLTISGRVLSADDQAPLAFANVVIKEKNIGVVADEEGRFQLSNICPGAYTIVCSRVGCDHAEHQIEVSGDLRFDFFLEEHGVKLDEVIIRERALAPPRTQAAEALSGADLESGKGLNLAEALRRIPGVNTLNTGATIAKPIIQGLHSNRVLILNNGVRQEGQQWGVEHAPEIDPFIADRVTVVKGANSVRYGADAIGGVILVEPRALRTQAGLGGELNVQGFSNGAVGVASGMIEGALEGKLPLSVRVQGTLKRGGNLRAPGYFLRNTGVLERNFSWNLGLRGARWESEIFYSNFFSLLGIFRDSHIGNLTDLQLAIEREHPLETSGFSYAIARPAQRVEHELLKWRGALATGDAGMLSLQITHQFNRRREFDVHRPAGVLPDQLDEANINFRIITRGADLLWEHRPWNNLRGSLGLHYQWQDNITTRGALIPDFTNHNAGVFWIERWRRPGSPLELEAGLRYDFRTMRVGRQGRDTIGQTLNFDSFSGSLGGVYTFPNHWRARLHFGTAWRPPHVSELYSDGVHHGSASYEKGRDDLVPERAYNTSLNVEWSDNDRFAASLTLYYNLIDNFIFLMPQERPVLTIRGAFPAFAYEQADARLMGLDWSFDYEWIPQFTLESRFSLLRARNRAVDDYLVFMPADRFQHGLRYDFRPKGEDGMPAPFLRLTMINVLEQTRAPAGIDYAPPPPGHTRFNLEGAMTLRWKRQSAEIGLAVFNLFNVRYREYLNRFRYFTDEPGRNISLRMKLIF